MGGLGGDRAVAQGIQHRAAVKFSRLSAVGTLGGQPESACLGTNGRYAAKYVVEVSTKKSGSPPRLLRFKTCTISVSMLTKFWTSDVDFLYENDNIK